MKDGELYVSPLTFEDVKEYSKINYCAKFCTDDRETKRADTTKGLVGHVHEVGRITKTYISHRKLKGFEMLKLAPWLNLTNNDPHIDAIKQWVTKDCHLDTLAIQSMLATEFGLSVSKTLVYKTMVDLGFSWKVLGVLLHSRNNEKTIKD
ncbi:hypothetical protein DSO57_1020072 [Entomophthora muscae]|uniref:Uncharacterized protein n=1 Tax=Entomophthora muscae TaxID=34485 RepID=A0ACC2TRH5_9FUNG|nr:hypothetical protein DSO57_1020072 [Entomophthora muscae]